MSDPALDDVAHSAASATSRHVLKQLHPLRQVGFAAPVHGMPVLWSTKWLVLADTSVRVKYFAIKTSPLIASATPLRGTVFVPMLYGRINILAPSSRSVRLGEGRRPARRGDEPATNRGDPLSAVFVMPMNAASVVESAHSVLQIGSRLLLMVAMALFVAYLMFLLSALVLSSAIATMRALRRPGISENKTIVTPLSPPVGDGRVNWPMAGAVEHALSA